MSKLPTAVICLSPNGGGMELDALKLGKLLSEEIELIMILQKGKFMHNQCLNNPEYSSLIFKTIQFQSSLSLSIFFAVRDLIKEKGIKNVIFFGASELKSIYFSFLGLDINLIVRHGTTKSKPKKDYFHRLIYSDVHYHIAISEHLLKNVNFIIPFGKKSILKTIIPSMVYEVKSDILENTRDIRILHVGRITKGKGLQEAIKACHTLDDFTLTSVGAMDVSYAAEFTEFLDSCDYKEKIIMSGFSNDVCTYYKSHNIFLYPSRGEGFGNVFMEALSHGLICIAFDNTAISDFKNMGFHCHLIEDANQEKLSETLEYVVEHFDEEKRLALINIEKAHHLFSKDRERDEYLALLQ